MNYVIQATALVLMNLLARQRQVINQVWSPIRSPRLNNNAAEFANNNMPAAFVTGDKADELTKQPQAFGKQLLTT